MCMDGGSFELVRGEEITPLENVATLLARAGGLTLIDVFGRKRELNGTISEIDLMNRRIVLA